MKCILKLITFLTIMLMMINLSFSEVEFEKNEVKDLIVVFEEKGLVHENINEEKKNEIMPFSIQSNTVEDINNENKKKFLEKQRTQKNTINNFIDNARERNIQEEYVKINKNESFKSNSILNNFNEESKNSARDSENPLSRIKVNNLEEFKTTPSYNYKNLFSGMTLKNIDEKTYFELLNTFPEYDFYEDEQVEIFISNQTRELLNISQSRDLGLNSTNLTGKGIKIAVLDTGVDPTHPDFGSCQGFAGEELIISYDSIPNTLESPHPYPDNYSKTFNITLPEYVDSFQIFFKNYSLDYFSDTIEIKNGSNQTVEILDDIGPTYNYTSKIIQGNRATITIESDLFNYSQFSYNYGFFINETRVNLSVSTVQCPKIVDNYDTYNDEELSYDGNGHGTHVASTIASNNSNPNLRGIAPEAELMIYKVLSDSGFGSLSAIIAGMERSLDPNNDSDFSDKADIISLSLGGSGNSNDLMSTTLDNLSQLGVIPIVAAGNDGAYNTIKSPGTSREAITVGATYKRNESYSIYTGNVDEIAQFSSKGPTNFGIVKPDIVAPGVNICAALSSYSSTSSTLCQGSNQHFATSGTSMATPIVSGVVALMKQKNSSLNTREVKSILRGTSKDIGLDIFTQGWGRVQPFEALSMNDISCQVYFNTSHLNSISEYRDNYSINASIQCPNFQNYTLEYSNLYSNFSIQNTSLIEEGFSQGQINLNFNITQSTSDYILLTLRADDDNISYNNYDSLLLSSVSEGITENNEIRSCTDINDPGVYNLTSDISYNTFDTSSECIDINSDDVEIDCRGNSISSQGSRNGIDISYGDNISILNCKIDSFQRGVDVLNSNNITIENTTFLNMFEGIDFAFGSNSKNIYITNSTFINLTYGVDSYSGLQNVLFEDINFLNVNYAFDLYEASNIVFDNIFSINTRYDDIDIGNSYNITLKNSFLSGDIDIFNSDLNSSYLIKDSILEGNLDLNINDPSMCSILNVENVTNSQGLEYIYHHSTSLNLNLQNISSIVLCSADNSQINDINIYNGTFKSYFSNNINISNVEVVNEIRNSNIIHLKKTNNSHFSNISIVDTQDDPIFQVLMHISEGFNNSYDELILKYSNISTTTGIEIDYSENQTFENIIVENAYTSLDLNRENSNNSFYSILFNNSYVGLILDDDNSYNDFININYYNTNFSNAFSGSGNFKNTFSGFEFSNETLQFYEVPTQSLNLNNTFILNSLNKSKFNITNETLQSSKFNSSINGEQIGNYWSDFTCLDSEYVNNVFKCNNPSNYTINSSLSVVDYAPLTIPPKPNITNIDKYNNSVFYVNKRALDLNFSFNRNITQLNVGVGNNRGNYTIIKENIFNNITGEKIPIMYGNNTLRLLIRDIYNITNSQEVNFRVILNSSNVENNLKVIGNITNIFTNINNISLKINNSNNLSKNFSNINNIRFDKSKTPIVEFNSNLSDRKLNLTNFQLRELIRDNKSQVLTSGIELDENNTKTMFIQLQGNISKDSSLCIADSPIDEFSQISRSCSQENETYVHTIPYNSNKYNVTVENSSSNLIKITGLIHSGLSQACTENWTYSSYSSCSGGTQTRTAQDSNNCGTTFTREQLSRSCTVENTDDNDNNEGSGAGPSSTNTNTNDNVDDSLDSNSINDENDFSTNAISDDASEENGNENGENIENKVKNNITFNSFNSNYSIEIDNNVLNLENSNSFEDERNIKINQQSISIVSFNHNFSKSELNLDEVVITNSLIDSRNYIIVSSLNFNSSDNTKTIRLKKNPSYSSVCVKDENINSIDDISDNCNSTNEYILNCDGESNSINLMCSIEDEYYVISGLKHSGAIEFENNTTSQNQEQEIQSSDSQSNSNWSGVAVGATLTLLFIVIIVVVIIIFASRKASQNNNDYNTTNNIFNNYHANNEKNTNTSSTTTASSSIVQDLTSVELEQLRLGRNYINENSPQFSKKDLLNGLELGGYSKNVIKQLKEEFNIT